MNGKSMTEGQPWKHILRFALPILAGSLLQQLYNTVDTIIVGKFYGEDALSAVGATVSFTFLFLALALGFSSGNGIVVAQYYEARDEKQVRTNASTGILLLMGIGVVATVIGVLVSRPAYTYLVEVPEELLEQTLLYFRVYLFGLIFQFGYNIFSSADDCAGKYHSFPLYPIVWRVSGSKSWCGGNVGRNWSSFHACAGEGLHRMWTV